MDKRAVHSLNTQIDILTCHFKASLLYRWHLIHQESHSLMSTTEIQFLCRNPLSSQSGHRECRLSKTCCRKLRGTYGLVVPVETSQRRMVVVAGMGISWKQSNVVVRSGHEVSFLCASAKGWKATSGTTGSWRRPNSNLYRVGCLQQSWRHLDPLYVTVCEIGHEICRRATV